MVKSNKSYRPQATFDEQRVHSSKVITFSSIYLLLSDKLDEVGFLANRQHARQTTPLLSLPYHVGEPESHSLTLTAGADSDVDAEGEQDDGEVEAMMIPIIQSAEDNPVDGLYHETHPAATATPNVESSLDELLASISMAKSSFTAGRSTLSAQQEAYAALDALRMALTRLNEPLAADSDMEHVTERSFHNSPAVSLLAPPIGRAATGDSDGASLGMSIKHDGSTSELPNSNSAQSSSAAIYASKHSNAVNSQHRKDAKSGLAIVCLLNRDICLSVRR